MPWLMWMAMLLWPAVAAAQAVQASTEGSGRHAAAFPQMLAVPGGILPPMYWPHQGAMLGMHPGLQLPSQQLSAPGSAAAASFMNAGKAGRGAAHVGSSEAQQLAAMQQQHLQLLAAHMLQLNPTQGPALLQQLQMQAQAQQGHSDGSRVVAAECGWSAVL
jgi:hypothetical protein